MENSDYRPISGPTPLTLPPREKIGPATPTMLPSLPAQLPAASPASAPAPLPVADRPASKPPIEKIVPNPKFVSPMPKIEETNSDIPSFLPVVAGIAAAVAITFSVLIYLKR